MAIAALYVSSSDIDKKLNSHQEKDITTISISE